MEEKYDAKLAHALCATIDAIRMDLWKCSTTHRLQEEWYECIRREKEDEEEAIRQKMAAKELFERIARETKAENEALIQKQAPKHLRRVLRTKRTRNVLAMRRLIRLAESPDTQLPRHVLKGMQTIGDSDKTGLWDETIKTAGATKEVKDFYAAAVKVREKPPTGFPKEALDQIITDIESDVSLGRYEEISLEELRAAPAYAFPKVEPTKVRLIIDERFKNGFSHLSEKVRLAGLRTITELIEAYTAPVGAEKREATRMPATQSKKELAAQVAGAIEKASGGKKEGESKEEARERRKQAWKKCRTEAAQAHASLREEIKKGGPGEGLRAGSLPEMGSRDWSKAYYQIGVEDPHQNPIAAWDSAKGAYRLYVANILNMGNRHSVPNWCRVAELVMRVMLRVAKTVSPIYIDDATVFGASRRSLEAGLQAYDALCDALGLELSDKAASNQASTDGDKVRVLGINYTWSRDDDPRIVANIPEEIYKKLEEYGTQLKSGLEKKALTQKTVQRFLGVANHIVVSHGTRAGMELLRGLYEWVADSFQEMVKNRNNRNALRRTVEAVQKLGEQRKPGTFRARARYRKRFLVQTDASTDGARKGGPKRAAVMWTPDGEVRVLEDETESEERIEVLEAEAVLRALEKWGHALQGEELLLGVDNITALYAMLKCSSKSAATQKTAVRIVEKLHELQTRVYYFYVPSEENVADFFTREELRQIAITILLPTLEPAAGCRAPTDTRTSPPPQEPNLGEGAGGSGRVPGRLGRKLPRVDLATPEAHRGPKATHGTQAGADHGNPPKRRRGCYASAQ